MTPSTRLLVFTVVVTIFAGSALAQNRYIVPAYVTLMSRPDREYRSRTTVTNLGDAPVAITAHTFTADPGPLPCNFASPPIGPGETAILLGDPNLFESCAQRVFTQVIDSPEPLLVRSRIESITVGTCVTRNFQEIPVASSWLASNADAIIPTFEAFPEARANLFVTNPNAFEIRVVFKEQAWGASREVAFDVAGESVEVVPVPPVPSTIPCGVNPCPNAYEAKISATGEFIAGISSIFPGGGELFFPAIPNPTKP